MQLITTGLAREEQQEVCQALSGTTLPCTPSCSTSLEKIWYGEGCPALARGSLSKAMQTQLPRLSASPAVAC